MKFITSAVAVFSIILVAYVPSDAAGTYTLRGAVITTDGTMVPEFTVTVRPVVNRPELVLRKRFHNGVFRIDGLKKQGYQIHVDSKRHARIRIEVDFNQLKDPTVFRTLILHRAVDRTGSALQAAAVTPTSPGTSTGLSDVSESPCATGMHLISDASPEDALASLGTCIRSFPNYVPALAAIGSIYLSMNRPDAALAYLRQAYKIDTTNAEVRLNMALAFRAKNNFGDATRILEPLVAEKRYRCRALFYLADVYSEQNKHTLAESTLRQALQEDPRMLDGWLLLVDLAIKQKNTDMIREGLMQMRIAMNNRVFTEFVNDQIASLNE